MWPRKSSERKLDRETQALLAAGATGEAPSQPARRRNRLRWAAIAIVGTAALVICGLRLNRGHVFNPDSPYYLLMSRGMLKTGSYRAVQLPGAPLYTWRPPGLSVLLLPVAAVFGEDVPAAKSIVVVCGALLAALVAAAVFKFAPARSGATGGTSNAPGSTGSARPFSAGSAKCTAVLAAVVAGLLVATNPYFVLLASELMAEVPYALCVVAVFLLLADRRGTVAAPISAALPSANGSDAGPSPTAADAAASQKASSTPTAAASAVSAIRTSPANDAAGENDRRWMFAAALIGFVPFLRTIGLTLVGAVGLAGLVQRRRKWLLAAAFGLLPNLWWMWRNSAAGGRSYAASLLSELRDDGVAAFLARAVNGGGYYYQQLVECLVPGALPGYPVYWRVLLDPPGIAAWTGPVAKIVGAVIVLLFLWGLLESGKLGRAAGLYTAAYLLGIAVWPYRHVRFVWPLIPLVWWFVPSGWRAFREWLRPFAAHPVRLDRILQTAAALVVAGLIANQAVNTSRMIADNLRVPAAVEFARFPATKTNTDAARTNGTDQAVNAQNGSGPFNVSNPQAANSEDSIANSGAEVPVDEAAEQWFAAERPPLYFCDWEAAGRWIAANTPADARLLTRHGSVIHTARRRQQIVLFESRSAQQLHESIERFAATHLVVPGRHLNMFRWELLDADTVYRLTPVYSARGVTVLAVAPNTTGRIRLSDDLGCGNVDALQAFCEVRPSRVDLQLKLAAELVRCRDPRLAIGVLRSLIDRRIVTADIVRTLGFVELRTGRPDRAAEAFRWALSLDLTRSAAAQSRRGLLAALAANPAADAIPVTPAVDGDPDSPESTPADDRRADDSPPDDSSAENTLPQNVPVDKTSPQHTPADTARKASTVANDPSTPRDWSAWARRIDTALNAQQFSVVWGEIRRLHAEAQAAGHAPPLPLRTRFAHLLWLSGETEAAVAEWQAAAATSDVTTEADRTAVAEAADRIALVQLEQRIRTWTQLSPAARRAARRTRQHQAGAPADSSQDSQPTDSKATPTSEPDRPAHADVETSATPVTVTDVLDCSARLSKLGLPGRAWQLLEAAASEFLDDRDFLIALATLRRRCGKLREAYVSWQRVLELDPNNEPARRALAELELWLTPPPL